MTDSLPPLHALVRQQADRLAAAGVALGHGTATPFDEAAWLVLWQLGLPLDTDLDDPAHAPPGKEQLQQVEELIQRRILTRQPAAYLTREAWLQGVAFYVDERAIIPRSLIAEILAHGSIDTFLHPDTHHVLDLCTGNGSLAVLAALAWPQVAVEAADISIDALAVAGINVKKHGLQKRIRLLQSDGLTNCPGPYDLILCNPPYVNTESMAALPKEFRAEPALALAGGKDGMEFIRPLLDAAPAHLSQRGVLVLEIGHERNHFEEAFPHLNPLWLETSAGGDQVLLLTREALLEQHA